MHRFMHLRTGFCTASALICASFCTLYALPGVTQYIPDSSGEYVYYQDKTFGRESYTGFLYYDDSTYAARYYAPQDKKQQLPEKSIELLFTVDPKEDHIKMTGERFLTTITPDDNEIVNYLHDMVYELTARRQKAGDISPAAENPKTDRLSFAEAGIIKEQDFMQFGGTVAVLFDYNVPIFNVKRISSRDGEVLFQAVTAGCLKSSKDTSFSQFTGIPQTLTDTEHVFKADTSAAKTAVTYPETPVQGQPVLSLQLDSAWKRSMGTMWLLGDSAMISMNTMELPQQSGDLYFNRIIRKLLQSAENSYCVWNTLQVVNKDGRLSVSCAYYQNKEGNITRDYKIITKIHDTAYGWFSLTVFDSIYRKNHAYFDAIISSYTITK